MNPIFGRSKPVVKVIDNTRPKQVEAQISESQALIAHLVESFDGLAFLVSKDFCIHFLKRPPWVSPQQAPGLCQPAGLATEPQKDCACPPDAHQPCPSTQRLPWLTTACQIPTCAPTDVGRRCHEVLFNRPTVCPFCVHDQVLNGETVRFEIQNPADHRWYSMVYAPIHHGDGSISMLALMTDIHDRKTADRSRVEVGLAPQPQDRCRQSTATRRNRFGTLVGDSGPMQSVYEQITQAAACDATVVIYGEPGTGKELVARAIHDTSLRHSRRFVPVHCGAIPENLVESEFFGYVKGAFSGAGADKQGYVNFADQGTLFMDEIGEISPHMQVKLLRVIEGGGFTPVGSNQVEYANIRIIAATNRDMQERIDAQRMRKDFFYRIHILPIYLPPLRYRKADLPLLIEHFMNLYGGNNRLAPIDARSMNQLMDYDWPGNVRELQNVIIRYCHSHKIQLMTDLTSPFETPVAAKFSGLHCAEKLRSLMDAYERKVIEQTLVNNRWQRSKVARLLGVNRKTLFTKMKQHGLTS
jgi:two-component system, NtrC family, response regulator AtoC